MGDIFKEQIIKREENLKDNMKKGAIIAFGVIIAIGFIIVLGLGAGLVIALVIAFICMYFINTFNVEYEYSVTNGELDIDKIINKTKRKNVYTADISQFDIMAHIDDKEHLGQFDTLKSVDFSSGKIYGNTYVIIGFFKGKKTKIIFEPNEDIVNAMMLTMTPKKLFKKK